MSEALHGGVLGQKSYSQFFSEHPAKGDREKAPGYTWSRTAHDRSLTTHTPVQFSETGAVGMGTGYRSGGWSMHEISTPPPPLPTCTPRAGMGFGPAFFRMEYARQKEPDEPPLLVKSGGSP